MKLVIAEKPDVAKHISKALNVTTKKGGYFEGNGYIISWCLGHLIGLAEPEEYDDALKKWSIESLPIIPDTWKLSINQSTSNQYHLLAKLMNGSEVSEIICATDAGREGELIFRFVYEKAKCNKPFRRLWVNSMESTAILKAFDALKDGNEYDNLRDAAYCRAKADWLVGINSTRLYTVSYNKLLRIGRVQTPTLAMIVERQGDIDNFISQKYYVIDALCGNFKASAKTNSDTTANEIKKKCDNKSGVITSVKKETNKVSAPKLYDLNALQRDANKIFGYSAQQTLDLTQSLYEKALVTYPRTDSQFLTTDIVLDKRILCTTQNSYLGFNKFQDLISQINPMQVIDDSKVSDHHAIIPTESISRADNLPDSEKNILLLICSRFLSALSAPQEYEETTVIIDCEGEAFKATGKTINYDGWKTIDSQFKELIKSDSNHVHNDEEGENDNLILPPLIEGQLIERISIAVFAKDTKPPKPFTDGSLLAAMENAKADSLLDKFDFKGIGTPATRANIIEGLLKSGFIERRGNNRAKYLFPTDLGKKLVSVAPEQLKSTQLTSEWEYYLQRIEHGECSSADFMSDIKDYITKVVKSLKLLPVPPDERFKPDEKESLGKCPRCGGNIYEGSKNYFCSEYKAESPCSFIIWKENNYFAVRGVSQLTKDQVKHLLNGGLVLKKIKAKSGATYNARFTVDTSTDKISYMQEFIN